MKIFSFKTKEIRNLRKLKRETKIDVETQIFAIAILQKDEFSGNKAAQMK